jgi:ADP-ribose pyrophosphatase YjhB (NUDIX family)
MKANIKQAIGTSSFNSGVGALFLSKTSSRYLFVLRNGARYDSMWAFVGGKVEPTESEYDALQREILEEIGFTPNILKTIPVEKFTNTKNNFTYSTYVCVVEEEFIPKLNSEHKGYAWSKLDSWPKPLHPGVFTTFQIDEIVEKIKTIQSLMCNGT